MLHLIVPTLASATPPTTFTAWHLTDPHVDPYYVVGSNANGCYCETAKSCARIGAKCDVLPSNDTHRAAPFGNSEGNCATPQSLYGSVVNFMAKTAPNAKSVYFTGDFAEAGAPYPCAPGDSGQTQLLDIINWDYATLNAAFAGTPGASPAVFGCLGNHDSSPGDIYLGTEAMQWLYANLSASWSPFLSVAAQATMQYGGWYATRPAATPGLVVVALNVNYWVNQNPTAKTNGSEAWLMGQAQFEWLNATLLDAEARGEKVHMLGHQPPLSPSWDGSVATVWVPGNWPRMANLMARFADTITVALFGHDHNDFFSVARSCEKTPPPAANASWHETTGIKWCSGGGDYAPGDVWGAGVDGICPRLPHEWDDATRIKACEKVCANATECVGFTYYQKPTTDDANSTEACFRTITTASKPLDANSTARCYEKPGARAQGFTCDGPPSIALLPGPALTEGFPATNPAVRLLEFDATTFELVEATTYTLNLHAANEASDSPTTASAVSSPVQWTRLYSFTKELGMSPPLNGAAFAALARKLNTSSGEGAAVYSQMRGQGDGSFFCSGYNETTAPFTPAYPCKACDTAECKARFVGEVLNGTNTL